MSTTTIPAPLIGTVSDRNRVLTLSFMEVTQCAHDLGSCALMPASEHQVSKLAGVAAGLDRAAQRIREALLGQKPPPPPDPALAQPRQPSTMEV